MTLDEIIAGLKTLRDAADMGARASLAMGVEDTILMHEANILAEAADLLEGFKPRPIAEAEPGEYALFIEWEACNQQEAGKAWGFGFYHPALGAVKLQEDRSFSGPATHFIPLDALPKPDHVNETAEN